MQNSVVWNYLTNATQTGEDQNTDESTHTSNSYTEDKTEKVTENTTRNVTENETENETVGETEKKNKDYTSVQHTMRIQQRTQIGLQTIMKIGMKTASLTSPKIPRDIMIPLRIQQESVIRLGSSRARQMKSIRKARIEKKMRRRQRKAELRKLSAGTLVLVGLNCWRLSVKPSSTWTK